MLIIGLAAAFAWTSLGLRAIVTDSAPSGRALFVCAALVLAGLALGWMVWIITEPKRAKQGAADATVRAESEAPHALLGIMVIGMGADPILNPSPDAWAWALLVIASLAGGMNLAVAFMWFAQRGCSCADEQSASRSGLQT